MICLKQMPVESCVLYFISAEVRELGIGGSKKQKRDQNIFIETSHSLYEMIQVTYSTADDKCFISEIQYRISHHEIRFFPIHSLNSR